MLSVKDVLLQRHKEKSIPGSRTDSYKVALSIEGGAMRGVVSAAMLCAIDQLGLLNSFDAIYGSSAGAINGAFLTTGQTRWGIRVYYEDINNNKFINHWRTFRSILGDKSCPIADVKYPVIEILLKSQRLDFSRVITSPVPLRIVASSIKHMQPVVLSEFANINELSTALVASSTMPGISGDPVDFRDDKYLDALLFERIPIHAVLKDNFTHILVLLTNHRDYQPRSRYLEDRLIIHLLSHLGEDIVHAYRQSAERYSKTLNLIRSLESKTIAGPLLQTIAPPFNLTVPGRLEKNRQRLIESSRRSYAESLRFFGVNNPIVVESLNAFNSNGYPCEAE